MMQILTRKSNRDAKSIVQDLNEIFNRRRERAMYKIQLKKNSKQSSEKKTVLDIIETNKVKRRNSGLNKQ